jgi:hypothetical protein
MELPARISPMVGPQGATMRTIIVRRAKPLSKTGKAKVTKLMTDHKAALTEEAFVSLRSGEPYDFELRMLETEETAWAVIYGLVDCGFEVEKVCRFCGVVFAHDDTAPCLTPADSVGCPWNRPTPKARLIDTKPLTEAQIRAMQALIDTGAIPALDQASGDTTWAREARLLIAGGKCKPPCTKKGKADFLLWGR